MRAEDINSLESESGVIATVIQHPDFIFYSEQLAPKHFVNKENKCVYMAIRNLAVKGILNIDPYNIISYLNSSEKTKEFTNILTVDKLNELVEMSDVLARHTIEEYKLLTDSVLDAAFRRNAFLKLQECESLCTKDSIEDIEQRIYGVLDDLMLEYSSKNEIPQYKDVVEDCWVEIQRRQGNGYGGIPFYIKALNDFCVIEQGELVIFAGAAKQGKSIMMLNIATDLLKQDYSVLYLDSELDTRMFTTRLLSNLSGVAFGKIKTGTYNDDEYNRVMKAKEWVKTRKFTHTYIPMFDIQSIYSAIHKVYHTQGIDVLIVDYFKGSGEGDAFDSYQELGRFTDFIKNKICGKMGICGIGAAQATDAGQVADSRKISRNASTIILMQDKTPEEIAEDGVECGNRKFRVVYNRNGAKHATREYISVGFDGDCMRYSNVKQHIPQTPY